MSLAFAAWILLSLVVSPAAPCMTCDSRLWTKFLDMLKRCLLVASEQQCASKLDPVISYTKDFTLDDRSLSTNTGSVKRARVSRIVSPTGNLKLVVGVTIRPPGQHSLTNPNRGIALLLARLGLAVYTDGMIQDFLRLMDLIYPFMFTLDYEPLDMLHAFLQVKLKAAVCAEECNHEYPVQVLHCSNCSISSVSCNWPVLCQGFESHQRKRNRRAIKGTDPQVAEKWRVAEMIMFPMIAILLIGVVALLIIILLWLKQTRENSAACNVGFRYLKDERVVPTFR